MKILGFSPHHIPRDSSSWPLKISRFVNRNCYILHGRQWLNWVLNQLLNLFYNSHSHCTFDCRANCRICVLDQEFLVGFIKLRHHWRTLLTKQETLPGYQIYGKSLVTQPKKGHDILLRNLYELVITSCIAQEEKTFWCITSKQKFQTHIYKQSAGIP